MYDIWEYDTTTDKWTQKANCPSNIGIDEASGFIIGNNIYVGTGQNSSATVYNFFWKYNTLSNMWYKEANFPGAARAICTAFAIADSGYIGLGSNDNVTCYGDFYKFYPDTLTGINEIAAGEKTISVYPNPSNGVFYIQTTNGNIKGIEVDNMLGEIVYEKTVLYNQVQYNINLSNATTGAYILKVYSTNGRVATSNLMLIK